MAVIKQGIDQTTHELVPLVRQLAAICEGKAGHYVHWGATTQDITDTGLILQVKAVHTILLRDLRALAEALQASKPAIVRALDTLGRHGFLRRRRDQADRRNVLVQRTVKGAVYLSEFADGVVRAGRPG